MPPAITAVRDLETAEELFTYLSPSTSPLWKHDDEIWRTQDGWVFRGQANAADGPIWDLHPSAHRKGDPFLPYRFAAAEPNPAQDPLTQRKEELRFVFDFAGLVDDHGFVLPSDSHELRDPRVQSPIVRNWRMFPPPPLVAMFALAQHHGVPTRLLDWSWKPLVAAYFAAEPVARRRKSGTTLDDNEAPFSVFALRREIAHACRGLATGIHLLSVPTATNANLHAQGGIFTLVQPTKNDEHPPPTIKEVLERHESEIKNSCPGKGTWEYMFPFLIEFRVPAREARTTLLTLRHMGVTAASVYPGLDGVVKALKERRFHQYAAPGSRS